MHSPADPYRTVPAAAADLVRMARLGGASLCVLVVLLLGAMLWSEHGNWLRRSAADLSNLSRAVEQQFWLGLRDAEDGLQGIARELAPLLAADGALDAATTERARWAVAPHAWHRAVRAVAVLDRDGRVLAARPVEQEGRYWQLPAAAERSRPGASLAMGPPRISDGRWTLPMAVPLQVGADGEVRYWVAAMLDVESLTGFLVHFDLGDSGLALIRHDSGAVIARFPRFPGTTAEPVLEGLPPPLREHESGHFLATLPDEHAERLLVHRGGDEYPFTVLVGRSADEVLATWRDSAWYAAVAMLAMMLGWLGVYALLERAHRRQLVMAERLEVQSLALTEAQRMGSIGNWEVDAGGAVCSASAEALRILGRSERHLAGGVATLFAQLHQADQVRTLEALEQAAAGAPAIELEVRLQHGDQPLRTLSLRGERVADPDGRVLLAGTVQDVSEWADARDRMREAEAQYRFLFDRNPMPMFVYDRESLRLLAVNDAAIRHYGHARERFLACSLLELVVADDVPTLLEVTRNWSPEDRSSMVWRHLKADGAEIQVTTHSVDTDFGGRKARIVLVIDVTERLRAEAQRSQSELRFSVVARAASDAIYDWDMENGALWWSDGFTKNFGHLMDDMLHVREWEARIHPDDHDRLFGSLQAAIDDGLDQWEGEYRLQRSDGGYAEVVDRTRFLRDASGKAVRAIGSMLDVTSRRRDEAQLRLLQRAIEASDNGIVVARAGAEGGQLPVVYVNAAFERMLGMDAQQLQACDLGREAGPGRAIPPTLLAMRDAIRSGNDAHALVQGTDGDAAWWHQLHVTPVRNAAGVVTHYVGVATDVSERERGQQQLTHRATHDALTGLPNRALVMQRIEQALEARLRDDSDVALLFIDLDHFKLINDTLGHETGDRMLKIVAERLLAAVPDAATIGRFGGDEFVVLVREARDSLAAEHAAERILAALTRPLDGLGTLHYLTPSIGFARCGDDLVNSDALLRRADMAMYEAKSRGRNCAVAFCAEFETAVTERLHLVSRLREALERDEFELAFQPQYCADSGQPLGLEALIRWRHPERGLLAPGAFIGAAEESGLIIPIGRWVLHEAARYHRLLSDAGWGGLTIAVNVSADQFLRGELLAEVEAAMALHRLPRGAIELELTESVVLENPEAAIATMHALREQGVTLAIDDFGTGYSSLNYLRELPADRLKLDRAFVADLGRDPKAAKICVTIMRLAQSLGLRVVAEGVEEWSQFDWLRENGCDEVQGYCFARPMAFHDVLGVLARGRITAPGTAVA